MEHKFAPAEKIRCKPFLKWAGGKRQMLDDLRPLIPGNFNRYIEPFIGGGAFFFDLCPRDAIISDANLELINTYKVIRDQPQSLITDLKRHKNDADYYYEVRALDISQLSEIERASRLIFLNKTCFNGLYRVNKKNEFNVPFGRRKNPTICDEDVLWQSSINLQNTVIRHGDYLEVLRDNAIPGDFVFLDPPYVPVGKHADFKRYTKDFFYKKDHEALRLEFERLHKLGCYVILTNSVTPYVQDLYKGFDQIVVDTKRMISSKSSTRTGQDLIVVSSKW